MNCNCVFTTTELRSGKFRHTCPGGTFVKPAKVYHRPCDCQFLVKPGECVHLGDQTRLEQCPTCGNKSVKVKVFACALHGECTYEKKVGELAVCRGCPDAVKRD